ncbi:DUF802 domain-containing protein [Mycetohabitans sp. B5]|uniref:Uncharacterized protein DUF802 n=1 Tax=Mycetohabitans endofungorum TaxID=417203 RepID=A0A2P5KB24_9BURK|nr:MULTISPECIES: DUF802 domain-containing protein [Mycetohabitans]MCG1054855.1 DUF802 domain-containing protein [Mycetohabitans sp. B5]PPB83928.1 uncharacterized protein DUF802 [Mycetohabitans endofungorum]
MTRFRLNVVVFLAGLAVVGWIGAGYLGSNPLASAVTLLIGAGYLAGALELRRNQQATVMLTRAVAGLSGPPPTLESWLAPLPAGLRSTVRQRLDGQRVALPGPVLTPYLVGLLVLLGMLGTLLGMVTTLRGTGAALQSATDLDAVRASLAVPVSALGFAFGTSIAGVATSAMLGLLSALCRRERIEAAQQLDTAIATTLRAHSSAHQRETTLQVLQRQADALPALVDRLQTMITHIERQTQTLSEQQLAGQQAFLDKVEHVHARLTSSVTQSLTECVADSARAAGTALQPVVQATMAGLARDTASLHDTVAGAVQQQLHALSTSLDATTRNVAAVWSDALADHRQSNDALLEHLRVSADRFTEAAEQRATSLLQTLSARLEANVATLAQTCQQTLTRQEQAAEQRAAHYQHALEAAAATLAQRSMASLDAMEQSQARLRAELQSQDEHRLATWTTTLTSMAATLRHQWDETSTRAAAQQQQICDTLARTAQQISAQANETIAEIGKLVQAASQAPLAAAQVIAELRQQLSDSLERDTAVLQERGQVLETLATLLDAINHASNEQRSAIDALVATSANLLERVGNRFTDEVRAGTQQLETTAVQLTSSAVEVASLGEAFGAAVQSFGASNDTLVEHLQRIEAALAKSLTRSDEQLAYYVAQAREVIDLSMMSQKQIVEELQQLATQQARAGAEAP